MRQNGLLIGEVAGRTGTSRKALRVYEAAGILPAARRTVAGYRIFEPETLALLTFVRKAQGLGFTLGEIKEIVDIRRAGRAPCRHVRDLVRRKAEALDQRLSDLLEIREGLRTLLSQWRSARGRRALVCPHIERTRTMKSKGYSMAMRRRTTQEKEGQ